MEKTESAIQKHSFFNSQKVNMAGVEDSSEEADGENYVFKFVKKDSDDSFECLQDRMFNLVGEQSGVNNAILNLYEI